MNKERNKNFLTVFKFGAMGVFLGILLGFLFGILIFALSYLAGWLEGPHYMRHFAPLQGVTFMGMAFGAILGGIFGGVVGSRK